MAKQLFIFQDKLESLLLNKSVKLKGNILRLATECSDYYLLTPAVKVLSCETSPSDPYNFIGKFIPIDLLTTNGADFFLNCFVYMKESYRVESGFLGTFHRPHNNQSSTV